MLTGVRVPTLVGLFCPTKGFSNACCFRAAFTVVASIGKATIRSTNKHESILSCSFVLFRVISWIGFRSLGVDLTQVIAQSKETAYGG